MLLCGDDLQGGENILTKLTWSSFTHWKYSVKVSSCTQWGWTLFELFTRIAKRIGLSASLQPRLNLPSPSLSPPPPLSLSLRRCFNFPKATTFQSTLKVKRFLLVEGDLHIYRGEREREIITRLWLRFVSPSGEPVQARNDWLFLQMRKSEKCVFFFLPGRHRQHPSSHNVRAETSECSIASSKQYLDCQELKR